VRSFSGVRPEEAPDLTQDFFIRILEGEILPGVDPDRGSFRHYLRGALRNFLLKDFRHGHTQKRGGGRKLLSLDFEHAGPMPAAAGGDPAEVLDRAWARQLLDEALKDLEAELAAEGRAREFDLFRSYDLAGGGESPSYADLAAKHAIPELEVWRILRSCRQRLRGLVMNRIGPYVRDGGELVREFQELFKF
jgi:RNA polymerase sigma-70 factor (ECF subfamily)